MNLKFYYTLYLQRIWLSILIITIGSTKYAAQLRNDDLHLLQPDTTVNKDRVILSSVIAGTTFIGSGIGLYQTWYSKYEQSPFHFFNDYGEWQHIDKLGHIYTSYFQATMSYKVAKWAGISETSSMWIGVGAGFVLQTTVEIFDGYSTKWGFSVPDFTSNVIGLGVFASQQHYWGEQRIRLKISSTLDRRYDNLTVNGFKNGDIRTTQLSTRIAELYGNSTAERFLKDYNAQTIWLSVNPSTFGIDILPKWLSIAIGYGAENMYGGFENKWTDDDGYAYHYPARRYPQVYLSPDIDWSRIPTQSHFLKTLFTLLNAQKIPLPTIEYNVQDGLVWHLVLWK